MEQHQSDAEEAVVFDQGILAFDHGWQSPAITELHAFRCMREGGGVPAGFTYVAFPWASLIDKLDMGTRDAGAWQACFERFRAQLPPDTVRVTVCQHIKFKAYLSLFRSCGISHVFWSHTTDLDLAEGEVGPRLHPFPLYPVQRAEGRAGERPHLFGFIGARADGYYMTEVRNWILEYLRDHPRGKIVSRESWHYDTVVHRHQVRHEISGDQPLVDEGASAEFRDGLRRVIFSLCPSGTGPNSIRLWESLGAGAIPVILSDRCALPGPAELWAEACLRVEETEESVRALPGLLEAIAADSDRLERMRRAGIRLWERYGPGDFVHDIRTLLRVPTDAPISPPTQPEPLSRILAGILIDRTGEVTASEARRFLRIHSADLLDGEVLIEDELGAKAVRRAVSVLGADDSSCRHYWKVRAARRAQKS